MGKTARCIKIIQILSSRDLINTKELADVLDTNPRNIKEYIKELEFDKFMELAKPYFDKSAIANLYDYNKFGRLLQSRIEIFSEIAEKVEFITHFDKFDNELYFNKKLKIDYLKAKDVLEVIIPKLENIEFSEDNLHEVITKTAEEMELKSGVVYTVLRIALTGVTVTPGGSVELADILGKDESIRRLKLSLEWLNESK